jgi:uncharacterized protein
MKKIYLCLITIFIFTKIQGQNIVGAWYGALDVQGIKLNLVVNISKTDNGIQATMDSPDQGAKGIPIASATFEGAVLKLNIAAAKAEYEGKLDADNTIKGIFKQRGNELPLNLSQTKTEKAKLVRPQEPTQPYPYYTEDVSFENTKDKAVLAGTLTLPKQEGIFPVVILISGSGPQNRDGEVLGHKPFLLWADYLTKKGIGVLRYDDRGVAKSKGGNAMSATSQSFADDVEAAVNYLLTRKEVNKKQIGLIGHSEGGIIAPMVAANSKDVNFIVLLAGSGIRGDKLLMLQNELILKARGKTDAEIKTELSTAQGTFDILLKKQAPDVLKKDLKAFFEEKLKSNPDIKPKEMSAESFINQQLGILTLPWMQYFVNYDPSLILKSVKCPVLAINGDKDLQVPSKVNLEGIKKGLEKGKNKNFTVKEFPNMNHFFQECKTGSPEEYGTIEQTVAPSVLSEVSNWILKILK